MYLWRSWLLTRLG